MPKGKIIFNGLSIEKHELETILFFAKRGENIELISPSNTPKNRRPDFIMNHLEWEMKSPKSTATTVVERSLHRALRQSVNIIIDLRRAQGNDQHAIKHLQKCFSSSKKAKRLLIITKQCKLLDYTK